MWITDICPATAASEHYSTQYSGKIQSAIKKCCTSSFSLTHHSPTKRHRQHAYSHTKIRFGFVGTHFRYVYSRSGCLSGASLIHPITASLSTTLAISYYWSHSLALTHSLVDENWIMRSAHNWNTHFSNWYHSQQTANPLLMVNDFAL